MRLSHAFLIAAGACSLATGSVQAGAGETPRASSANTQLVIRRAANFGNHSSINLFIDGRRIAIVQYGQKYEGAISAGLHLIRMQQTPHLNDAYPFSQQWIRLTPGQTSVFTAIWRDGGERIGLEES
jgi:hypothetical protein